MVQSSRELARLYALYKRTVYRRSLQILGNVADAEEAVQDVFLKIQKTDLELDGPQGLAWVYRTTTNHCLDHLRVHKRRREIIREDVKPMTADRHTPTADARMTLRALLAKADPKLARCATYIYIDQLPHAEAAKLLDCSERTINNLLRRFRAWAETQVKG